MSSLLIIFIINNQCSITKSVNTKFTKVSNINDAYIKAITTDLKPFTKIKYSAKITENNKTNNLSGYISVLNDSLLSFNIVSRTLGIEIMKVKCRPDSLFFIDKINKKYYAGNYSYLSKYSKFNLNYKLLKSIFLAKAEGISFPYSDSTINFFKTDSSNNNFYFHYANKFLNTKDFEFVKYPYFEHKFTVNGYGLIAKSSYNKVGNNFTIILNYNYSENSNLPNYYTIKLNNNSKVLDLTIKYLEVSNDEFKINYKVPNNYDLIK